MGCKICKAKLNMICALICAGCLAFGVMAGLSGVVAARANSDFSLIYKLDFSDQANIGKNSADTAFSDAVVQPDTTLTVGSGPKGKPSLVFPGGTTFKNYLQLPTEVMEGRDAVTLAGWFKVDSDAESYLGEIGIHSPENGKAFRTDPYGEHFGNAYLIVVGDTADSGENVDRLGNTKVKPVYDGWYHMAYVYDGVRHVFEVYQNGAPVLSQKLNEAYSPDQFHSATSHFYLGQSAYEDNHKDYKGSMSDFRVYAGALDAAAIQSEYGLDIFDFNTASYTFDAQDSLFTDSVRGYNLAAFRSAPTFAEVDGRTAMHVQNGASVKAFDKPDNQNVKFFDGHANLTMSMDVKVNSRDQWKRIWDMYVEESNRLTCMSHCPRVPGACLDVVYHTGADQNLLGDNSFVLPDTWVNLTFVFSGRTVKTYADGQLKVTAKISDDRADFTSFIAALSNGADSNFVIGSNSYEDHNGINAYFDNVKIFAAAAGDEDVAAIIDGYYSYTVSFNANGGSGEMASQRIKKGAAENLSANTFTYDGYDFNGWNTSADGSGTPYAAGASVTLAADLVLYAQWVSNSHTVTFDANGGRGTMETQRIVFGREEALRKAEYYKTGYDFGGWNTSADGKGSAYADEAAVTLDGDVTLYAIWTAKNYTVTFNANGGVGEMPTQSLTFDTAANLTGNAFIKKGYAFAGWAYEPTSVKVFGDGESVTGILEGDDVTLYAVWILSNFTVTLDANGGSGNMTAIEAPAYTTVALTENAFTKEGCAFAGWALTADGEAVYADKDAVALDDDITLYAVWKENSVPVDPDDGEGGGNGNVSGEKQSLTKGQIAGIVVGSVAGGGVVIAGGVFLSLYWIKKRKVK